MNFENKKYTVNINGSSFDVHVSRIIASWHNECSSVEFLNNTRPKARFANWLKSLELSEDEAKEIIQFANNGKMELEISARIFINKNE